ncbi:hypothetical protein EOQ17_12570 [Staphylococcus pseudintermedius]|uniref:hypothetical protein n=1 Tax=Staphylococcus pseudintermedius TaxID=283734 RepID=UPI000C1B8798|nr:hypothetical protein [Staphylococcus pseudintermedius]EGQ0303382.1 hypothetical protein [Staphylococcus pseudintermedius]EGQ1687357.1 hypothetical protein [Staphylococcus pseudintermedius]EGQ1736227.1 hypothetical protein [Staphylococcus pseudintermedius]EGQ1748649.1 hypothetical protein [Staphylococcus pseudintermedius]EGQ2747327.1 hypothetical protein [Staphylococcus pseudintermedius]
MINFIFKIFKIYLKLLVFSFVLSLVLFITPFMIASFFTDNESIRVAAALLVGIPFGFITAILVVFEEYQE